jgi:Zn-dependent peptidase ImmA (M78 family)
VNRARKSQDPKMRAQEVLAELDVMRCPVAVDYIAQKKGITVRFMPLEEGLSGMIFAKHTAIIIVNSLHHPNRQRFTLAHELGHFELHMKEIGAEVHVDKKFLAFARDAKSSLGLDRKEVEANRFAGELLVPQQLLIQELRGRVIDAEDEALIAELADRFEVSRQMMTFRIGELVESPQGVEVVRPPLKRISN